MPDTIVPKTELPHNQWLEENKEFVGQSKMPREIVNTINGWGLSYSKYAKSEGEKTEELYQKILAQSYTIADTLQTWKEKDLPDPDAEPTPEPLTAEQQQAAALETELADAGEGAQIINGKVVTATQIAENAKLATEATEKAAAEEKTSIKDNQQKSNAVNGFFAALGITAFVSGLIWWLKK